MEEAQQPACCASVFRSGIRARFLGSLVTGALDWVLAEFLRLYHNVSADEASRMVNDIVTREAPVVQDFNGFLKVLTPNLGPTDRCLVLLCHRGREGATFEELSNWVPPRMRGNLRRTLTTLCDTKDEVHFDGSRYQITQLGERDVESRRLIEPRQLS
jgi:hypothetical protein